MEANRNILMEKLSGAFGEINHSVLAHKYRETTLVVKELMLKIVHRFQEKADNSEIVKYLKENAKYLIFHLTRKLSIVNPYIHKALENRLAIAYISLLLGFIGGRYWMQGYPQLQSQQMLSAVCGSYSGHESVALCRIPVPRLTSNYQVLVKVMSAGVDKSDMLSVSGWARVERAKPHGGFTLGRDFCGVVVEAGHGVTHVHPGDRVWGAVPYHQSGTLSEQIVVWGSNVTRMPSNLNWEGGATVPYSAMQVWLAIVTAGHLVPDQAAGVRVLIIDGVTDTGCLATQLCCLWGAHVTVVCAPRAVQLAAALGAHMVIPSQESSISMITNIQEASPYHLIVQCGDILPISKIQLLKSIQTKTTSTLPTLLATDGWGYFRRVFWHPLWRSLISAPQSPPSTIIKESLSYVQEAVQKGKLQPVLDKVFSPSEVSSALQRLATQDIVGKSVVLFDRI